MRLRTYVEAILARRRVGRADVGVHFLLVVVPLATRLPLSRRVHSSRDDDAFRRTLPVRSATKMAA